MKELGIAVAAFIGTFLFYVVAAEVLTAMSAVFGGTGPMIFFFVVTVVIAFGIVKVVGE